MKKSHNLMLISAGVLALGIAASFTFNSFNNGHILPVKADTSVSGALITFDDSGIISNVDNTVTIRSSTTSGGTIYCKLFNIVGKNDNSIGTVTEGTVIRFYESDATTEYTFEDIDRLIILRVNTTNTFGFTTSVTYADGRINSYPANVNTTQERKIGFTGASYGNVSNLHVEVTTINSIPLKRIQLEYNCTAKHQNGVSITTAPTKTSYSAGEYFDPAGMAVAATYDNNTQVATTSFTYTSRPLTLDDEYVEVFHNGFVTHQPITVVESYSFTPGVYKSGSYKIDFNDLFYVNYSSLNNRVEFTYAVTGNIITFTFTGQRTSENLSQYALDMDSEGNTVSSRTATLIADNTIKVTLTKGFPSAYVQDFTFTKA